MLSIGLADSSTADNVVIQQNKNLAITNNVTTATNLGTIKEITINFEVGLWSLGKETLLYPKLSLLSWLKIDLQVDSDIILF